MALKHAGGQYVKVLGIEQGNAILARYKDEDMRTREKNNQLSDFEKVIIDQELFPYEERLAYFPDNSKNMIDNEKTMVYQYLKRLDKYSNTQNV